jgi:hypothetical protein
MSENGMTGSCLCQRVTFAVRDNAGTFQYCHCSRCRKFTGSAFAASLLVRPDDFEWLTGEEYVGRYEVPEARHYATCFCLKCGSSLPWPTKSGRAVIVPAGTLDSDPGTRPVQNIYCASRAVWYVEPGRMPMHDELPPKEE